MRVWPYIDPLSVEQDLHSVAQYTYVISWRSAGNLYCCNTSSPVL